MIKNLEADVKALLVDTWVSANQLFRFKTSSYLRPQLELKPFYHRYHFYHLRTRATQLTSPPLVGSQVPQDPLPTVNVC